MASAPRPSPWGGGSGTQTLVIQGASVNNSSLTLGAGGTINSQGVLVMHTSGGSFSLLTGGGTLTNSGALNAPVVAGGTGTIYIRQNIANSGSMDIGSPNGLEDQGNTITNSGTFTTDPANVGLSIPAGALSVTGGNFVDTSGTLVNNGALNVSGSSTFTRTATTASGNDVVLTGGTLTVNGSGAGAFDLFNGINLAGNISSGQTVKVLGTSVNNSTTTIQNTMTNAGTLVMDTSGGGLSQLAGNGFTLTNTAA